MNETVVTSIPVFVNKNKEIIVTAKSKDKKPQFQMVASEKEIDALRIIADMNSYEKFCFFMIKDNMIYNYEKNRIEYVVKIPKFSSQAKKNNFNRGYKTLKQKGLVKRIKRGYYMINPSFLIPSNYSYWKIEWDKIID